MRLLFIHQNFPGQYRHAAAYLAKNGHHVVFITQQPGREISGLRKITYVASADPSHTNPYLADTNAAVFNGIAVASCCEALKTEGFRPDIVVGHNGWGEILYIKDVWPTVPLLGYFEFFYRSSGSDVGFDPEFPVTDDLARSVRTRNAVNLLGLDAADWGQTPTEWQRDQYPRCHWSRLSVIHEGVDSDIVRPEPKAQVWIEKGALLSRADEVITYTARNLEPYRGFHVFMRALPKVLERRPRAHILIVGGDGVSYGRRPSRAATWRRQMLSELNGQIDLNRIHFLGHLSYRQYLAILQLSAAHIYLSYPFVLSWSLIEAMSAGCLVIGSRTPPVEEVITDGDNGYLVDFFDIGGLVDKIAFACTRAERHEPVRRAARATVQRRYDLRTVCLPALLSLFGRLAKQET
jgi:glycosyltransferase involved in cell wall biosynthesis